MDGPRSVPMRTVPWLAVLVPVANATLVVTGVLDLRTAVVVGVALEVLLVGVLVAEIAVFRRAYGAARRTGATQSEAVWAGIDTTLPGPLAFLVRSEAGLGVALWRAVRGRDCVEPGDVAISYVSRIGMMLWIVTGLGVVEVVVVHLLLPWAVARWIALAVSAYGLSWLLALHASLRQHPHLLRRPDRRLLLRFGHFRTTTVPLGTLTGAGTRATIDHRRNVEVDDDRLSVSVMGETNVHLRFDPPVTVTLGGRDHHCVTVDFFADDPRETVARLRAAVPTAP